MIKRVCFSLAIAALMWFVAARSSTYLVEVVRQYVDAMAADES